VLCALASRRIIGKHDIDVRSESASQGSGRPVSVCSQFVSAFVQSATLSSALDVDVVINISREYPSSFCDSHVWPRLSGLEVLLLSRLCEMRKHGGEKRPSHTVRGIVCTTIPQHNE